MMPSSNHRHYSRFIPSEEVGAVTQWKFGAVDGSDLLPPEPEPEPVALPEEPVFDEAAQLALVQQACDDAYAKGFAQGQAETALEWQRRMDDYVAQQGQELAQSLLSVSNEANFNDVSGPGKFIPERRYWKSNFESAIQFSQNHVSANWHKGGSSNLNVFTRNYLRYDYNKDKVQLTNEMELKASFYNAPKDTIHDYKIGDDVFRLHSNLGYKAFNKWFYTFDAEFKTQLFTNYKENSTQQLAALLSPFSVNIGVGMKYELDKAFKDKHKKLKLTVNMAPASFTYLYSIKDNIDLARHGFRDNKRSLSKFGSTLRTDLNYNISRNVNWQSRFYYFTSYDQVVGEFENTLTLAISRFFSTRIYLHLRFDDGVKKKEDIDTYFQMNELLSFGFNYKW